ncbi:hypothetical protein V8C26DRAFT_440353 [Trichoderma gracile]
MPPVTTPRGRQKQANDSRRVRFASSPTPPSAPGSRDEGLPRRGQQKGLKESIFRPSPEKAGLVPRKSPSSTKTKTTTEASDRSIDQYPVTKLVLDLERREQQAQDKYDSLKKKFRELDAALELSNKERKKEKSIVEGDYRELQDALNAATKELRREKKRSDEIRTKNESLLNELADYEDTIEDLKVENSTAKANLETLEAAHIAIQKELAAEKQKVKQKSNNIQSAEHDALVRQLEQEQNKTKEMRATNESLASVLEAQAQEKDALAKMLEEKTYESWIFRCAVGVIYKDSPVDERLKMGKLIRDVIFYLCDKRQRERLAEQQQADDDETDNQEDEDDGQEQEQAVEAAPHHEQPGPEVSDAGDSGLDSEDLPLGGRATRQKRHRARRMDYSDYFATSDDSDDEKPLVQVLKKRAKKLKTTSSHKEASSAD